MENTNKKVSNVKMYDDNITTYISNLSSIAREKTDDIQKDISNITYACLGFFLVINEHFTPLKNSSYRLFLYISVFLFILSIFYSLFYKNRLSSYCREIVTFALSERKKIFNDPKNVSLDDINNFYDRIEEKTDLNNKKLDCYSKLNSIFLFLAIVTEIIYFILNLDKSIVENESLFHFVNLF